MNHQDLRAYAVRGLSARLAELDQERSRILELLSQWEDTADVPPRERRANATASVQTAPALAAAQPALAAPAPPETPPARPEPDVARILPRRRGARPTLEAAVPVPSLPPMPRLVKATAS